MNLFPSANFSLSFYHHRDFYWILVSFLLTPQQSVLSLTFKVIFLISVSSNTAWSFLLISRDRSKVIVPSVWWELYTDPIMLCFLAICALKDKKNKMILYSVDHLICQQGGLVGQMVPQKMTAD